MFSNKNFLGQHMLKMNNIFQCLPSEVLKHIKFLALEPSPTSKIISELKFTESHIWAFGDTRFLRIACWKQFLKFQNGKFKVSKLTCLVKKDKFFKFPEFPSLRMTW